MTHGLDIAIVAKQYVLLDFAGFLAINRYLQVLQSSRFQR